MARWLSFALLLFGLTPARSATLERLSLEDMIAQSTAIVRAKVTGSYAVRRGPVIYTYYSVQTSEQLKGPKPVTVAVPGGTLNNLRQSFPGAPELKAGDEFVFFLWTGSSGITQIMGLTQGLFQISLGQSRDPVAMRAATSELMLERGTGRQVKDQALVMKLSELRSRIASQVGQGGTR
ncbi:MAG TPA: hypothetical protein VGF16_08040 [Bryobacteraceae bacterium]